MLPDMDRLGSIHKVSMIEDNPYATRCGMRFMWSFDHQVACQFRQTYNVSGRVEGSGIFGRFWTYLEPIIPGRGIEMVVDAFGDKNREISVSCGRF